MPSPYFMTPTGLASVKIAAQIMGQRLRELRAEREAADALRRAALPPLPEFKL